MGKSAVSVSGMPPMPEPGSQVLQMRRLASRFARHGFAGAAGANGMASRLPWSGGQRHGTSAGVPRRRAFPDGVFRQPPSAEIMNHHLERMSRHFLRNKRREFVVIQNNGQSVASPESVSATEFSTRYCLRSFRLP
jgi:hypothetical protein